MIFLFLWTLVVTGGMLFLFLRHRAIQMQLEEERRNHDLVTRQHRDVVSALRTNEMRDSMVL